MHRLAFRRWGARIKGTLENFRAGTALRQRWPAKAGTPYWDASTQLAVQLHGLGFTRRDVWWREQLKFFDTPNDCASFAG